MSTEEIVTLLKQYPYIQDQKFSDEQLTHIAYVFYSLHVRKINGRKNRA